MKNLIFTICLSVAVSFSFAQIDVVGPNGNVGVGIASPSSKLDVNGNMKVRGPNLLIGQGAGSNQVGLQVGDGRSAQGAASFELIADKNSYPDYGFRFIRYPNGFTNMDYRGSQNFVINGTDGGSIFFSTSGNAKFSVQSNRIESTVQAYKPGGGMWAALSDRRSKESIKPYDKGLDELLQVNPISYKYKVDFLEDNGETHVGVIAQEVQEIVPSMVKAYTHLDIEAKKTEGYLSVDPSEFTYMLINSVKEQQNLIQKLQDQVKDLSRLVNDLQSETATTLSISDIDADKPFLAQNTPNPLSENTKIEYYLPENTKKAFINMFDLNGKLIKSQPLSGTGIGSINLKIEDVSSGLYTYSLTIDGVMIDTKKMIIE